MLPVFNQAPNTLVQADILEFADTLRAYACKPRFFRNWNARLRESFWGELEKLYPSDHVVVNYVNYRLCSTLFSTATRSHLVNLNKLTTPPQGHHSGSNNSSLARMQTFLSPVTTTSSQPLDTGDSIRASVGHLLTRAYSLPCSTAAMAFNQLVQPTSRFQLALDALLPLLDSNTTAELANRILVSFILYSLYAPHPIAVNPFKSALFVAYLKEREKAVKISTDGSVSPNEQLVWVLWKILKGDGNDIGPYSPSTLARSPLPTKLRAINLVLDDELCSTISDLDDSTYSYFQNKRRQSASSDLNEQIKPRVVSPEYAALRSPITLEEDRGNERLVHAIKLLLASRERVLTLSEQRILAPIIPEVASSRLVASLDLTPIAAYNPTIAHPLFVGLLTSSNPEHNNPLPFLDVLPFLPPTLATFDLLGRLLRDSTRVSVPGYGSVAELVRVEVLGRFVHEAINWLDCAEREEREGLISDDRFAKGVQNLCRFYNSLTKLSIVDPAADTDSAEMAHFSLRNARLEEANALYRVLARGRY
ncbi:uncharacterized protein LACBIDRAFT_312952 [Laccaria bicolor S238N-H82]|uniref:Predicted protein n=1 Tax=Laccaria bicolor (strain S238N-H82 / ATCC MYA-4686) TaxID=486041 RepID=B0DX70_LACBS|nr:uncharacterized protein LACBIDRAFT_312952 [Laccaria bicolor S238N-H82]EDR00781.1 predicted protein [Laccaria bicolor S238N-H82]|eukprot:XP_001888573.1 predicted protein [Laccaria bicolor S238N-H82]